MKKIYVCSPYHGDVITNVNNAQNYCKLLIQYKYIPVAPHLYFPQFLDDRCPEDRALGIKYGLELLSECDALYIFGDTISEGMQQEIAYAMSHNIPVTRCEVHTQPSSEYSAQACLDRVSDALLGPNIREKLSKILSNSNIDKVISDTIIAKYGD